MFGFGHTMKTGAGCCTSKKILPPSVTMNERLTSELVYISSSIDDLYGQEYTRRMETFGFTKEKIIEAYAKEKEILRTRTFVRNYYSLSAEAWGFTDFFPQEFNMAAMPKENELTLSELILVTEEANFIAMAYKGQVGVLDTFLPELYFAIWDCADFDPSFGDGCYHVKYESRAKKVGWIPCQIKKYYNYDYNILTKFKDYLIDNWKWKARKPMEDFH